MAKLEELKADLDAEYATWAANDPAYNAADDARAWAAFAAYKAELKKQEENSDG